MVITCSLTKNGVTIDLFVTKYVEGCKNTISRFARPVTQANRDTRDSQNRVIDMGRVTFDILIEGYITDTSATGHPANYTAFQVKEKLLDFVRGDFTNSVQAGGAATLVYRSATTNYGKTFNGSGTNLSSGNVFIEDIRIEEVDSDQDNTSTSDSQGRFNSAKYFYSLKLLVGNERS